MAVYWCNFHKNYHKDLICVDTAEEPVAYPVTDFADRLSEEDVDRLKQRIFDLEAILSAIHEQSKL
jgi:hypothetical protein